MKKVFVVTILLFITLSFADFNRTSGLIDIPTANILPHLGFRAGIDATTGLGTNPRTEGFESNLHFALGLTGKLELYLDIYSFGDLTAAVGFCHRFVNNEKFKGAWGVHCVSYDLDVSELGHGDSVGWWDDLSYNHDDYEKPFELGSAFAIGTWTPHPRLDLTFGIGRGRYVGYGTHSKYFNTNAFSDCGGNWGVGLIAGGELKFSENVSLIFEGDSRDLNFGMTGKFQPVEIGIGVSKFEFWIWKDGTEPYQPRFTTSISYVRVRQEPKLGTIAGTVHTVDGEVLIAQINILDSKYDPRITDPYVGEYRFEKISPGTYEVFAVADGYIAETKLVSVIGGRTAVCNFDLEKERVKTGSIKGKAVDYKTKEPLIVDLTVVQTDRTARSDDQGGFVFGDLEPDIYEIRAQALNYEPGLYPVVVNEGKESDMLIQMVKRGMVITLEGVQFDLNKASLRPESYLILNEAAAILVNHPEIRVEIHGHTCSLGSDSYNMKLSDARANSVRDYLVMKHDINPARLSAKGYGETQPVADNRTEEGRIQNRRVDFVILE
ncbi:OmpA family protein [candidate division WOR-3 bacterium]|nr:OmpA family protein [candidate division WOR-3 bacterium]